ncbi:MAG: terminase, partial [Patescibacteria group bacterium]|nr:terminase [Patescibacteria group bacterium]
SEYGKVSAKYPEKAREIKTGALNTVESGQQIFVESTAEGKTGEFFDLCEQARKLKTEGKKLTPMEPKFHFYAWFNNPEYRLSDEDTALTVIPQETVDYLAKIPGLDKNQIAWYAAKEKTQGDDMRREYPSTPEEAFEGSLEGAYFTKEMALVRAAGQITNVAYDRKYPVYTFWDIGQSRDQMSIWFYQYVQNRHHFIDYHESNDQGWNFYANLLKSKDYNYAEHEWPHDGTKRIVGLEVQTSKQLAEQVGIRPIFIQKRTDNADADVRNFCKPVLPNCWFDQTKCALGIKRLDDYRRKWDRINSMWLNEHQHDEASHGSDAYRTFAVSIDNILKKIGAKKTVAPSLALSGRSPI